MFFFLNIPLFMMGRGVHGTGWNGTPLSRVLSRVPSRPVRSPTTKTKGGPTVRSVEYPLELSKGSRGLPPKCSRSHSLVLVALFRTPEPRS